MKNIKWLIVILAALCHGMVWAQEWEGFLRMDMRNGLSENRVRCIVPMPDGRMAIATTATIDVFDGTRFVSYPLPPERAYPLTGYRGMRQLTCDPQGRIWLRNNLTLYVVDTRAGQVVANMDSLLATLQLTPDQVAAWPCPKDTSHWGDLPQVMTVAKDVYGGLWIGTKEQGILYRNQARIRQFTTEYCPFPYSNRPNFCSPRASQLATRYAPLATNCTLDDLKGYAYLGTRRGVMIIDSTDRLIATLDHRYGLSTDNVQSIIRDKHGQVWIATANGISRIRTVGRDSFDITNYSHPDGIFLNGSEFRTCQIHCDSAGVITAGFVGGIIRFHPDSVNVPRHTFHYPSHDSISAPAHHENSPIRYGWGIGIGILLLLGASGWRYFSRHLHSFRHDSFPTISALLPKEASDDTLHRLKSSSPAPTVDELFLQRLRTIVEEHISDEDFSVQKLSSLMAMERTVLYRRMQTLTKVSPSEYIRSIRMNVATRLLKETDFPISEIALRTGFSSTKYFSQVFKKSYGVMPSEYRDEK